MCKLGADVNGTVFDDAGAKIKAVEKITGLSVPRAKFAGRETINRGTLFRPRDGGEKRPITHNEYDQALKLLFETDCLFSYLMPHAGAVDAIRMLALEMNCEVALISSARGLKQEALWHLASVHNLPVTEVIAAFNESKKPYYAQCAAVVDDDIRHLHGVAEFGVTPMLMRPHLFSGRTDAPLRPRGLRDDIVVVQSWQDVARHVKPLALAA